MRHLDVIAQGLDRFDARVLAYCLMGNHYHLVLRTGQPNLSALMRHINGVYTQIFNRRHALAGHLFQGRFKAILVDTDAYLMSLCRYVERNPVAAHLVRRATEWPWSSCRAHTGLAKAPEWLDVQALHAFVLGHAPRNAADVRQACRGYLARVDGDSGDDVVWWWPLRNPKTAIVAGLCVVTLWKLFAEMRQDFINSRRVARCRRERPAPIPSRKGIPVTKVLFSLGSSGFFFFALLFCF